MKKKGNLCSLIYLSLSLFLMACTVTNIICNKSWLQYAEKEQIKSIIGAGLIFCSLLVLTILWYRKNWRFSYVVVAVLVGCIQLFMISQLVSEVGWDCGAVINAAFGSDSIEESNRYLSVYPNNLFLVLFYRVLFQLLHVQSIMGAYHVAAVVNLICIQMAMYYLYCALRLLFYKNETGMGLFFFILVFVFSPWLVIPYSDVVSMPFTIFLCYQYLKLGIKKANKEEVKNKMIWILAIVTMVGMWIKPTVLIVSISGWFYLGIKSGRKKDSKYGKQLFLFLVVCLLLQIIWNGVVNIQPWYKLDQSRRMTYTHYLMLGANNNRGVYTQEDYEISQGEQDVPSRQRKNLDLLKSRLKQKGLNGYLQHIWNKSCMIHSEGNFFWGGEGGMNFLNFDLSRHSVMRSIYFINGTNYDIYKYGVQGIWFILLLVAGSGILSIDQKHSPEQMMIALTIWGIVLFNALFEARSRYLIPFLPIYSVMFCYGVQVIENKTVGLKRKVKAVWREIR